AVLRRAQPARARGGPADRRRDADLAAGAVGARPRRRGELLHRSGLAGRGPTAGHRGRGHGRRGGAHALVATPRRTLLARAAEHLRGL
ncbi:MAG: Uncharacterized amino acid permease, GabP family, partial [uncultured Friedmanniella sp.]